jgi:hypothetical protein
LQDGVLHEAAAGLEDAPAKGEHIADQMTACPCVLLNSALRDCLFCHSNSDMGSGVVLRCRV